MGALLDTADASRARIAGARNVAGRLRLLAGTSAVALLLAASAPALAQSAGGAGGGSDGGGTSNVSVVGGAGGGYRAPGGAGTGGNGSGEFDGSGGGGGGANAAGGAGGQGGETTGTEYPGGAGGLAGVAGVLNGAGGAGGAGNGANSWGAGGGGGGGGADGTVATGSLTLPANSIGGAGGAGGSASAGQPGFASGAGGGGGAGGNGVTVTGAGASIIVNAASFVSGGNGGNGGSGIVGGDGGDGGVGVVFTGGGALNNAGTIQGGVGGAGGAGLTAFDYPNGAAGADAAGVVGAGLTIVNNGSISGGGAANAISFTGGGNTLTTNENGSYSGAIDISSDNAGVLTLKQTAAAGSTNYSTVGQFTGAGTLQVTTDANISVTISADNAGFTGTTTVTAGSTLILAKTEVVDIPFFLDTPQVQPVAPTYDTNVGTNTITLAAGATLALQGVNINNQIYAGSDPTIQVTGANGTGGLTGAGDYNIVGTSGSAATDVLTINSASSNTGATTIGDGTTLHAVTVIAGGAGFFSANSATTVTASSILDLGGFAQTINTVSLTGGTIQNGNLAGAISSAGGFVSNIGGTASLTTTAGTTTLLGTNGYTGATNVNGGILTASAANAFSQISVTTINTGGTVDLGGVAQSITTVDLAGGTIQNGSLTGAIASTGGAINGINGTASLTTTSGTTTLSGTNGYTGATNVNGGILTATAANAFSQTSVTTINTGGTVDLGGFAQSINTVDLAGGTLKDGTLTGAIASTGGAINGINGTATLTTTSGTTTLSGTNGYTGATNVNGGILTASAANAFSQTSVTTINTGGTVDLGGFAQSIATVDLAGGTLKDGSLTGAIASTGGTINGINGTASLTVTSGTTFLSGTNGYGGATNVNGGVLAAANANAFSAVSVLTINTGGAVNLGGVAQTINTVDLSGGTLHSGSLAGAIVSTGGAIHDLDGSATLTTNSGTTTLSNANGYTGATNVDGGTLKAANANAFSANSLTTINTGGTLNLNGFAQTITTVDLAGGTIQNGSLAGAISSAGGFVSNIGGTASLTTTAGTTTLSGTNGYTGATHVNGGILTASAANAFSQTSVTTINAGGTVDLGGFAQSITTVDLAGGTLKDGILTGAIASTGGAINGINGTATLTTTSGTTTLSGTNGYTGATNVNGGILTASAANAFSQTSVTTINTGGTVDLGGLAQSINTVDLAGGTIQNGSLTGAISSTGGAINGLNGSASLGVTSGTTTLSGANGYTGATNVNGGILTASAANAFSAASTTTINTGGTVDLGGLAQTINTVDLAGGTLQNGSLTGAIASTGGTINSIIGTSTLTTTAGTTTLTGTNVFASVSNGAGAFIVNNGTTTDDLNNAGTYTNNGIENAAVASNTGTITNNSGANWNGDVKAGANTAGGLITNLGTWTGTGNNDGGTLNNSGTWTGDINNNSGNFNNNGGATVSGTVTNAGTGTNAGTIASLSNTGGTFNNTNQITGSLAVSGGLVTNSGTVGGSATVLAGTLTTTGTISNGLFNFATVNAAGTINGAIFNDAGTFTVTGGLANNGGTFTNQSGATLDVKGGAFTGLAELDNNAGGIVTVENTLSVPTINQSGQFTISPTGVVTTTTFTQSLGTTINNGSLTATNPIAVNGGLLRNNATIIGSVDNGAGGIFRNFAPGTVSGDVTNSGAASNSGLISGLVTNNAGVFQNTGEIDGGVVNAATFNAAGTIKGAIANNAGTFTVTGALSSDNSSTFTNASGATLDVKSGPFTNLATLTNNAGGVVTVENTLSATTINQNGTFTSTGTVNSQAFLNAGTANLQGALNAPVTNTGSFIVTGNLVGNGANFDNNGTGTLSFSAANATYSGLGVLSNNSTASPGISVGVTDAISAVTINNAAGATITSAGSLIASANINNASGGTINSAGVITTSGEFANAGLANVAGTINGKVDNQATGVFNVTAALASDGVSIITNDAGGQLDVQAAFTNVATLNNSGTATVEAAGSLGVTTLNQYVGLFTNKGTITATNPVNVIGGNFDNVGTINGGADVTGGVLTTTGTINNGLTNSASVFAAGNISGGVTNSGSFVVTGALNNNGGNFNNKVGGAVSFQSAGLTYSNIGAFTNDGVVTIGQYPANTTDTIGTNTFANNADGVVTGIGTINGAVTNNGSIYVGAQNAPVSGYNLTVGGAYSGSGIVYAAADLNTAKANTITVTGAVTGSPLLNIAISGQGSNTYFGSLTVANDTGAGFTDTPATQAALANASKGFYVYSYGQTAKGQGILQVPNSAIAAAPLSQVTSVISALNTSFFQNSAAFLGQAVCPTPGAAAPSGDGLPTHKGGDQAAACPAPNQVNFGVWNRDAAGDTNIASSNTVVNNPAATSQASHLDTRLAGFQYGLDAGLFNINNSGFNTHLGVTAGDVFTSSTEHTLPGITTTAEIPFVGAYGALTGKGFAGIVGVRYDTYKLDLDNGFEGIHDQALGAHGLTFTTDVQYVIPLGTAAFVEPSAGVYVSKVNVDNQTFAAGTNSFAPIDSTLSRLGLRLGIATQAAGILLQPFVAGNVYHEWAGDTHETFTPVSAGATPQLIDSTRIGTFGQASVGVGWQVPNTGWTGYVRSDAKFGSQVEGWTLTAGLRYNW